MFQDTVFPFFNLPCFLLFLLVTFFCLFFFIYCFNLVFVCEYAINLFKKANLESVSEIIQCKCCQWNSGEPSILCLMTIMELLRVFTLLISHPHQMLLSKLLMVLDHLVFKLCKQLSCSLANFSSGEQHWARYWWSFGHSC